MAFRPIAYVPGYPGVGSPHYPGNDLSLPGSPLLWFSAQDINAGAAQPSDGAALATWKNKGSLGAAFDAAQPGAPKPVFRLVADGAKIGGKSAVQSDGTQHMGSPAGSAMAQPTILAVVFKVTNLATNHTVFDGGSATNNLSVFSGTGNMAIYSGTNYNVQAIPANTWEMCVAKFNGATSFNRLNGSQSANGNAGTNLGTLAGLFSVAGATIMNGMIAEVLLYGATSPPALADIETYLRGVYGITPQ